MPESFSPNQPPSDPAKIEALRKEWEAKKRKSTIAHKSEVPSGGADLITNFSLRKDAREGAASIGSQLKSKRINLQDLATPTASTEVKERQKFGLPGLMQKLRLRFSSSNKNVLGTTLQQLSEVDAGALASAGSAGFADMGNPAKWQKSPDTLDRIASRQDGVEVDLSRYIEGVQLYCDEIDALLVSRYTNIDSEFMQVEIALARKKVEGWRKLIAELQEVQADEIAGIPFYKKSVEEAFGDAAELARSLSLRKFK